MSWSIPFEEFKHSLRIYIDASGGMSMELSAMTIKLVDLFETIRTNGNPSAEFQGLATLLIKSLVDTVQQRLEIMEIEEATSAASTISEQKATLPANNLHHKIHYLRLLAQGYRALDKLTDKTYPKVTTIDGVEL